MDVFKRISATAALATAALAPIAVVASAASADAAQAQGTHHVVVNTGEHRMSDTWPI